MSRALRVLCLVAIVICLWNSGITTAYALSDPPPWRRHLDCDPADQHYRGVEYCTFANGDIHVVVVDLHSPGVRLEYVLTEGVNARGQLGECRDVNVPQFGPVRGGCAEPKNRNAYPVMSLSRAVELAQQRHPNTAVVINSDYGACSPATPSCNQSHGPEGLTVVRGDRLDGPANGDTDNNAVRRPWLVVSRNAPLQAEVGQFSPGQDNGGKPYNWVYTGVGGGPWLLRGGQMQDDDIRTCKNVDGACYAGAAQTAVGLSQDRRWLFLVVDGRKGKLQELATFMKHTLDAWDAIKFDGGSSSQLWYGGRIITSGDGRQLSQYLVMLAEPGTGIEDTISLADLSAQPTAPLFFDIIQPTETAHLVIELRNTGAVVWDPDQGFALIQLDRTGEPTGDTYPLSQSIAPGETGRWQIALPVPQQRFTTLHFQIARRGQPFGTPARAVVITLPEQLRGLEDRLRATIKEQIEQWRNAAEQELEQRLQDLEALVVEWIQRELEKQVNNLLEQLCSGAALAPLAAAFVFIHRRKRERV